MPVALQRWPAWRCSAGNRFGLFDDLQIDTDVDVIADQPAAGFERTPLQDDDKRFTRQ